MKDRGTQNNKLDEIGQALLAASKMPTDDIERIVGEPYLFSSIKARIEREKAGDKRNFGRQWKWRPVMAAYSALALLIAGAIGVSLREKNVKTVTDDYKVSAVPDRAIPSKPITVTPPINNLTADETKNAPLVQKASLRNRVKSEHHRQAKSEEAGEFYPLTYTDDSDTSDDAGQIVRVELPRSSLLAMGVDVPADNNTDRVKTDLLIGSDGVMKAVRLVK
jgi:hypothetical protein